MNNPVVEIRSSLVDNGNQVSLVDNITTNLDFSTNVTLRGIEGGNGIIVQLADADDGLYANQDKKIILSVSGGVGLGTVASVDINAAPGLAVSGGPITTNGVFALALVPATESSIGGLTPQDKIKLDGISGSNTGDQQIQLTGAITGIGGSGNLTTIATTLSQTGVSAGTYQNATFTVGLDGRITSAASGQPLYPGETNTGMNIGPGFGLFAQKVGVTLQFKSLVAGPGVYIQEFSDSLQIQVAPGPDGGAVYQVQNVGTGQGIYANEVDGVVSLLSLTAGTGITLVPSATDITINASNPTIDVLGAYIVSKNGNDTIGNGSYSAPFLSISAAVLSAPDGSVIEVGPGIYTENVTLLNRNNLTIRGSSGYEGQQTQIQGKIWLNNSNTVSLQSMDVYNTTDLALQITGGSSHRIDKMSLRVSPTTNNAILVESSLSNDVWFNDCYIEGVVVNNITSAGMVRFFGLVSALATFNLVSTTATTTIENSPTIGAVSHSAGTLFLSNIGQIVLNTAGASVYSMANSGSGLLLMNNVGLQQSNLGFGSLNKTGTCSYAISNVGRNPAIDTLNGTRTNFGSFSDDISADYTPSHYIPSGPSLLNHLAAIDQVLANISPATTGSNLGSGTGIFAQTANNDLQFKTLIAGAGISIANDANTVTLTSTAPETELNDVYFVSKTGSDLNDGSLTNPFFTVQAAVTAAGSTPTVIVVTPGSYVENVIFTSQTEITITGLNGYTSYQTQILGKLQLNQSTSLHIKNIDLYNTSDYALQVSDGAGHRFENVSVRRSDQASGAILVQGAPTSDIWFNNCYIEGNVLVNTTSSIYTKFFGINSSLATFTIGSAGSSVAIINSPAIGLVIHQAGVMYLQNVGNIYPNINGESIVSTADTTAGNQFTLLSSNLQAPNLSYGKINKTGTCPYIISNTNRNTQIDITNGLRSNFGSFADDISGDYTPAHYLVADNSVKSHLVGIDSALTYISQGNWSGNVITTAEGGTGSDLSALLPNQLVIGTGSNLAGVAVPTVTGSILSYNGTGLVWSPAIPGSVTGAANEGTGVGIFDTNNAGTLEFFSLISGSSTLSVGAPVSGNISLDVIESALTLDNIGGVLSTNKGGTGADFSTLVPNQVIYSNGGGLAATSVPTMANTALTYNGSTLIWSPIPNATVTGATSNGSGSPVYGSNISGILQFNSILAGSSKLSVASPVSGNIVVDVVSSNIDINTLGGSVLSTSKGGTGTNLGALLANQLVFSNGSGLNGVTAPSAANTMLTFNGTSILWTPIASQSVTGATNEGSGVGLYNTNNAGVLNFFSLNAGSSKLIVSAPANGSVALDVNESSIQINNLAGALSVSKGGTGANLSTLITNQVLFNGSSGITGAPVPTTANQVLTYNGTTLIWAPPVGSNVTGAANTGTGTGIFESNNAGVLTFYSLTPASSKIQINNPVSGNIGIDVVESSINVNNTYGILATTKGGTGANLSSLTANQILYSSGAGIVGAPAPGSVGSILSYNGTGLVWTTPSYGTVTGGNNLGVGVGVFASDNAGILEYNTLSPASSKISIANPVNNVIYFDVDEGALTLNNLNGVLSVSKGGTGSNLSTLAANQFVYSNGSVLVGLAAPTTANTVLTYNGTNPVWSSVSGILPVTGAANEGTGVGIFNTNNAGTLEFFSLLSGSNKLSVSTPSNGNISLNVVEGNMVLNNISGVLDLNKGGTGADLTVLPANSLLYSNGSNLLGVEVPTVSNTVLTFNGFGLVWSTPSGGGSGGVSGGANEGTGIGIFDSNQAGILNFNSITGSSTISVAAPVNNTIAISVIASGLSLQNLGGTLNLATQVSGILSMADGGTGANLSSLTADQILYSNGSNVVGIVAPSISGTVLTYNGSGIAWTSPTTGLTNVSNLGLGNVGAIGLFDTVSSNVAEFYSLVPGSSKVLLSGPNSGSITVDIEPSNILINDLNGTLQLNKGGTGSDLSSLAADQIVYSNGSNLLGISAPTASGQVLTYNGSGITWTTSVSATNLGTGNAVYAGEVSNNLTFKTLLAGSNVTLSTTANDITINAIVPSATEVGLNGTLVVSKDGDDLTADGSFTLPYLTIGAAISAASNNTVILVTPGTYTENITVTGLTDLVIKGTSGVYGSATSINGTVTFTNGNTCHLENILVYNAGGQCLTISGGSNLRFKDLSLECTAGNSAVSISGNVTGNVWFDDCYIAGNINNNNTGTGFVRIFNMKSTLGVVYMDSATGMMSVENSPDIGTVYHLAGKLFLSNIGLIAKNTSGISVSSTSTTVSDLLYMDNVSLQQRDQTYGTILQSGTCGYELINVNRNPSLDTLNGSRVNFGSVGDDISVDHNPVNYTALDTSVKNQIAGIDTALGTIDTSVASKISHIIQDTNPQLGANLDVNGFAISSIVNGNVNISPNGTGSTIINSVIVERTGQFSSIGDIQVARYQLRNATSSNTATNLYLNGVSSNISMLNNSVWSFKAIVVGKSTTSSDAAAWEFSGVVTNFSNTLTIVGSPMKTQLGYTDNTWDVNVVLDNTNTSFTFSVIGSTTNDLRWSANVEVTELN